MIWLVLIRITGAFGDDADLLYLNGGASLTGVSRGVEGGLLRWEMPHGTLIAVPLSEINRIEYRAPDSVPEAPAVPEILSVRPDVAENLELASRDADDEFSDFDAAGNAYRVFGKRDFQLMEDWTKRIEFGGRFLDGNSNEDFFNVFGKFEREAGIRFYQVEMGGQYGRANGAQTTERWYGNATIDFCKDGEWIIFVTSKNEFDEFENLDYRGTFSAGFGYRFYNEEIRRLILRVGPATTYEQFLDPRQTRITPDIFGEFELRWQVFDRTEIEHKTTVNPSVEDFEVFRLISTYGLLVRLDTDATWSMKIGLRHEYNSSPNDDREHSDFTTSILLVYQRR